MLGIREYAFSVLVSGLFYFVLCSCWEFYIILINTYPKREKRIGLGRAWFSLTSISVGYLLELKFMSLYKMVSRFQGKGSVPG